MSSVEYLREFVNERLTAAAEEIFGVFKRTIVEYEEELERQRRLLDSVWKPENEIYRKELPQQHVCKEEEEDEFPADQQPCIQESSGLDQEEPEPLQIKQEQEELCSSQQGEQLEDTEGFMLTVSYEEGDHREDQTLDFNSEDTLSASETESVDNIPVITYVIPEANSDHQLRPHNSQVAERQAQKGGERGDSGSTGNAELHSKESDHASNSQTNNVYASTTSNMHHNTRTGEKSFKCETCGKVFKVRSRLQKHTRIHTGEKPYLCTTCGKKFSYKSVLKKHIRIHTGEKPCLCTICGKRLCNMTSLTRHIRTHTGEKPYACKICGAAYRVNDDLKVHMRIHTGDKPYLCSTCGKRFNNISALKNHVRIHTGEKPFICMCGKAFRQKGTLMFHMKLHSGEKS
ncbi:zinc finger protein 664-like [Plectropomus leopardus]|uniref:zinc finger protein 664-like n=1 Tax=Plectropomus leopardus TaxID=160734 RepID=UPI001C4D96B0|nr:zinc finger protein 664-like [Plectropomus leopardus]